MLVIIGLELQGEIIFASVVALQPINLSEYKWRSQISEYKIY